MPISAPGGETELQLAALSLGDLLSQRLSSLPGVTLRASGLAAEASLATQSLTELAERVGAELVLTGSIERSPQSGNGQVELALLDLRDGASSRRWVPWRYDLPLLEGSEDLAPFRRTTEAIVERVADELRLDIDPAAAALSAASAPRDLKAYRLFLLAFGKQAEVSCMGSGAAEMLRESLALDSRYAPAWQAYASAEYNRAWACGEAREHYEKALEALARAEALAPTRLGAILRAIILAETGRVEEGYAVLAEAHGRWPGDAALDFQRAQLLHYAGFLDEADRHFERSLAADPLFAAEGWIPRTPFYRGDYARFLALLPAIESPIFRFYRAMAELGRGGETEAKRLLEPVFRMNPGDLFARLSQALLALLEGNAREGGIILDHLALQREELGGSDGEVTFKIAQLYARAGQSDKALRQLGLAVEQGFFCAACVRAEPLFRALHGQREFQRLLLAADRRHREFGQRFELGENE
jgi:tetratricopeptide (TPR) repeat protein